MAHRPRKRFGQHFLHDRGVVARIVEAIAPRPDDVLIEIGPGRGALTYPLLRAAGRLEVVELDRELIPELVAGARGLGHLVVHSGDALTVDLHEISDGRPARVVGNLPYNISTPLIFHLLGQAGAVVDMHFMLQREVVERMCAGPGDAAYGRLSVMVQYRCRVERLFTLGSGAFTPAPKVESAFVRLVPRSSAPVAVTDERWFERIVAQAFGQRRKTLRNALRGWVDEETMRSVGIDPSLRAERIGIAGFAALANAARPTSGSRPTG